MSVKREKREGKAEEEVCLDYMKTNVAKLGWSWRTMERMIESQTVCFLTKEVLEGFSLRSSQKASMVGQYRCR